MKTGVFSYAVLALFLASGGEAATRYVDLNNASPSGTYENWGAAATSIQDAVDVAVEGDTVLVTNGFYSLSAGIIITNAITLESVNGPEVTIIDGNYTGPCIQLAGVQHPVNDTIISGFTVQHGSFGGILRASDDEDKHIVNNCIITDNRSDYLGAGVHGCTLNNCQVLNNQITTLSGTGGGTYNCVANHCTIRGNAAGAETSGGGMFGGIANHCVISSNTAFYGGGTASTTVTNSTLIGNSATFYGGMQSGSAYNSVLIGNYAQQQGGGTYWSTLDNCLLLRNSSGWQGGGSFNGVLNNCTLVGNTTKHQGGGIYGGTVHNSILWGNSSENQGDNHYTGTFLHCNSPDLTHGVDGNITNAPGFLDAMVDHYKLAPGSACIDAGSNVWAVGSMDLAGAPRIINGTVEIGAYEWIPSLIENLSVAQREGAKLVEVSYDIVNTTSTEVTVFLVVSNGSSAVNAVSLSGDVGAGIIPGTGKSMVWNAGADWNGNVADLSYTLKIEPAAQSVGVAPLPQTGETNSFHSGDDGDLQTGVKWPSPRFSDQGDGTILDNLSGLEWVKAPHGLPGNSNKQSWNDAVDFCEGLSYSSHANWHLPSRRELMSLIEFGADLGSDSSGLPTGHPFSGLMLNPEIWSSTTDVSTPTQAWMALYCEFAQLPKTRLLSVWPVRKPTSSAALAPVPETGQTTSFRTGDDGDLEAGVDWPNPRFSDLGTGIVQDHLTGLEWIKEPHSLGGKVVWTNALDYCGSLTYAGKSGWRLPNIKELESLIHCGSGAWGTRPYQWLNSSETPFTVIPTTTSDYYWSSSSYFVSAYGWTARLYEGQVRYRTKTGVAYIWPVRDIPAEPVDLMETTIEITDSRNYLVTISTPYGSPVPGIGTHTSYCWKSEVNATVDAVVSSGGTNYTCIGWQGTGSVPIVGNGTNTGPIVLTTVSSSIDWRWIVDADADRMPDDWELQYFGSETAGVATNDVDGDGYLNWQEYILGSNPTNGGSSFLFTPGPSQPTSTAFSIDFTTVTGRLYTVECTDELGSGNWQALTNFIGDGSAAQIVDPANIPACFYQVRIDWAE